jgi:hypothetical protein
VDKVWPERKGETVPTRIFDKQLELMTQTLLPLLRLFIGHLRRERERDVNKGEGERRVQSGLTRASNFIELAKCSFRFATSRALHASHQRASDRQTDSLRAMSHLVSFATFNCNLRHSLTMSALFRFESNLSRLNAPTGKLIRRAVVAANAAVDDGCSESLFLLIHRCLS